MSHGLVAEHAHLAGPLEFVVGLPVLLIGRLLRQHEGLPALEPAHDIVLHGHKVGRIVGPGVVVPAHHVQALGQRELIQLLDEAGHVGLHGDLRVVLFQHPVLVHEALRRGIGDEAHVVQLNGGVEAVVVVQLRGQGDLLKAGDDAPPEGGVPMLVQPLHGAVTLAQPQAELRLAGGAVAIGAVFVGHMPHGQGRVMGVALGELLGNGCGPLPVFQAVDAEEHAHAVGALAALNIHRQHLRVAGGQPGGLGGGGSGQADVDTVCPYLVDDPVQPAKIVHALVRLQLRPGEHRQGQQVDARLAEQTHILSDSRLVPLVGVVVAAVINLFCLQHG